MTELVIDISVSNQHKMHCQNTTTLEYFFLPTMDKYYTQNEVWDSIIYPFSNFNRRIVEFWE